jgi:hypothetical protein
MPCDGIEKKKSPKPKPLGALPPLDHRREPVRTDREIVLEKYPDACRGSVLLPSDRAKSGWVKRWRISTTRYLVSDYKSTPDAAWESAATRIRKEGNQ